MVRTNAGIRLSPGIMVRCHLLDAHGWLPPGYALFSGFLAVVLEHFQLYRAERLTGGIASAPNALFQRRGIRFLFSERAIDYYIKKYSRPRMLSGFLLPQLDRIAGIDVFRLGWYRLDSLSDEL